MPALNFVSPGVPYLLAFQLSQIKRKERLHQKSPSEAELTVNAFVRFQNHSVSPPASQVYFSLPLMKTFLAPCSPVLAPFALV